MIWEIIGAVLQVIGWILFGLYFVTAINTASLGDYGKATFEILVAIAFLMALKI